MKAHLERLIRRARGGAVYWPRLAKLVASMSDDEAEALYRVLQSIEEDARQDGKRGLAKKYGMPFLR